MGTMTQDRYTAFADEQWERSEPLLPSNEGRMGRPFVNNRMIVVGIVYQTRTGIPLWTARGHDVLTMAQVRLSREGLAVMQSWRPCCDSAGEPRGFKGDKT